MRRFGLLFLLILFLSGCNSLSASDSRPEPLPQDRYIQVYFNHNRARGADYRDPYREIERSGDDLEKVIIEAITGARESIDLAVQELRLPNIAFALAERHRSGVKVRVILENLYNRPIDINGKFSDNEEKEQEIRENLIALIDINKDGKISKDEIDKRDAIVILNNAGVPTIDDTADRSKGSGLMHHKFLVIDNRITIIGSANYSMSDIHGDFTNPKTIGNANHLLKIDSPELAEIFTGEFNILWGTDGTPKFGIDKPYREPRTVNVGDSRVTVKFSPDASKYPWNLTTNGFIGENLNRATKSVDMALFVFTEQPLADILETKHAGGVEIEALIDRGFIFRDYSEGLDLLGVAVAKNCEYERDNRPWKEPITGVGFPELPEGDKLHHKFALVDGEIIITGSHNWSKSANYRNDETSIVIENKSIAEHFNREFQQLYKNARLGLSKKMKERIERDRRDCPLQ